MPTPSPTIETMVSTNTDIGRNPATMCTSANEITIAINNYPGLQPFYEDLQKKSYKDARELLSRSFQKRTSVVGLTGNETWRLIHESADSGVAGGSTYDAAILACARKAGADRILTLDRKDFMRLAPDDIEILVP